MHNQNRKRDPSVVNNSSNNSLLEASLSYDMYSYWIPAQEFSLNTDASFASTPVYTDASATLPGGWVFSATLSGCSTAYIRRHLEWRDGLVYAIPHMFHSTNTGDVVLTIGIYVGTNDSIMPVISTATAQRKTITVPGTANTLDVLKETEYLDDDKWARELITEENHGVFVHFMRFGGAAGDTCAGTTRLVGIELRYLEGNRGLGQKWDGYRRNN